MKENNYKHSILLMGGALSDDPFAVTSIPTNYYIDHNGIIVARENGFAEASVPHMEERILSLVEKRKQALANPSGK